MSLSLNPNDLQVASFQTDATSSDQLIGGGTEYPVCIVYVSDCVSCPPDDGNVTA